ncbi:MAG TPA: Ig-like domain-containing protein [Longimicrobium sp.]|nr:Ig-like domain-containing protein [Longimicrobium sp.]
MPSLAASCRTGLRRGAALPVAALLALAAACADRDPVSPPEPAPAPRTPALLAAVRCTANVTAATLSCGRGALPAAARGYVIVGGQHQYVELASSNVAYNAGVLSFDVTVGNLIPQPMGTTDGATPDAEGVRVIFSSGPTVTVGTGPVSVANADGTGTFTAAGQPFFRYTKELGADGILSQNEASSAKSWQFSVPAGATTFTFQLYVVAEVPHPTGYIDVTPGADSVLAGGNASLSGTVRTVVGEVVPGQSITWGTSNASVATVDGSGGVTAVAPGTVTITATAGARSGTATIAVCPNLAVGGVYVADMPAGSSLCLGGGGSGAEYTAVPVNVSEADTVALNVTGSGIVPVSGAPTPIRVPGIARAPVGDWARAEDFGARLRLRDRGQMARLIPSARLQPKNGPAAVRRAITPGVPAVGALMSLNVETDNSCSTFDTRTGRVMAVGTHVIVMADTANPAGGLAAADYAAIADSFDTFVYPVDVANFGAPTDRDGNGRVIAFYTRAVNELTPPGSSSYVGGFFFSRDLLPATACPTSNAGEMFYMLAADPSGTVNGNVRSVGFVTSTTVGTMAHEFQHMINAGRRLYVNSAPGFEQVWLDEGLAHVAEELVFYDRAGLAPGANLGIAQLGASSARLDAFFTYQEANFGRLRQWLLSPHTNGGFQQDDDLATRGAGWAFLRYAADRKGGTQPSFWFSLVNSTQAGLANLQAVLGTDPLPWYRDFTAALYADDAGLSPAAAYTLPSWDFRSIYAGLDYAPGPACSCAYELAVRNPANGVADSFTLPAAGAAAYLRMGVSPGAFAGLATRSGGVAPTASIRMLVIRRK